MSAHSVAVVIFITAASFGCNSSLTSTGQKIEDRRATAGPDPIPTPSSNTDPNAMTIPTPTPTADPSPTPTPTPNPTDDEEEDVALDGYTFVAKEVSGLAYNYSIMTYEASFTATGSVGADIVTTNEADLTTCAFNLHSSNNPSHASCGSHITTKIAVSAADVTPATSVTFAQAFWSCRNATNDKYLVRLATKEEWLRASKWIGPTYQGMWDTYTNNTGNNCLISGGAPLSTGARSSCKSAVGPFDMAGNVKEWVDERMVAYDISAAGESRFSYGPTIGRTLKNGIHQVSYRFHEINPGTGLALALGADYKTPTFADRKQYGPGVQTWLNPATSDGATGFRCVAFRKSKKPSMASLALPFEPTLANADVPTPDGTGAPATAKAPENFYTKDLEAESVTIAGTVAGHNGSVTISWSPWSKEVCNPTCTSVDTGYSYRIYRFIEPTRQAVRALLPWALGDITGNPYSSDQALDPLATDLDGVARYHPVATVLNCSSAAPGNCTYSDSGAEFSEMQIYRYILVAVDGDGNAIPGYIQRYRSPYFAGDPATGAQVAFRQELRWRHAAVFLTDETYQTTQTPAQVMVHVPLNVSGLDHDFFMQKYEAAAADGGSIDNAAAQSNHPLAANTALDTPEPGAIGTWVANAAKCHDKFLQAPTAFDATCGSNTTARTLQSKTGLAVQKDISQGALWKACRNSTIATGSFTYHLYLPTDSEWLKAADWGDVNQNGTIDQHPSLSGHSVATIEYTIGNAGGECNTTGSPGLKTTGSATSANCRSRFGAADMVGNIMEWANGRHYSNSGFDDGMSGLWLSHGLRQVSENPNAGIYDLLRGTVPESGEGAHISANSDYYFQNTSLRGSIRGSDYDDNGSSGRWTVGVNFGPTQNYGRLGGRCAGPTP